MTNGGLALVQKTKQTGFSKGKYASPKKNKDLKKTARKKDIRLYYINIMIDKKRKKRSPGKGHSKTRQKY